VLIATGRKKRTREAEKRERFYQSPEECPFDDLEKSGQEVVWKQPDPQLWKIAVIKNKYPAVLSGNCGPTEAFGPYSVHGGRGTHDVFIYRNHETQLHDFSTEELVMVTRAYKKHMREIGDSGGCTKYVMLFHNFGREAGASIYHAHSQIISTPILPSSVQRSLFGAYRFHAEHRRRVSDVMMFWEKEQGKRVVLENDFFIAFCPFASRHPAEVRIYPKSGHSHFEEMPDEIDKYFADMLRVVLQKIKKAFDEPSFNFYIHTAPVEQTLGDIHEFYSWHMEILPKLKIDAGFELGTGIDINVVDPDEAATMLREA